MLTPTTPSSPDESRADLPPLPTFGPLLSVPPVQSTWKPTPPTERVAPLPPLPNFRPIFAAPTREAAPSEASGTTSAPSEPGTVGPAHDDTVRLPENLGRRRRHRRSSAPRAESALHSDDRAVDAPPAPRGRALVIGTSERAASAVIATQLTHSGYRIALQQPDPAGVEAERITDLLARGHLVAAADHTDPDALSSVVEQVADVFGRLDLLVVVSAGADIAVTAEQPAWSEAWSQALSQELLGTAMVVQSAARVFRHAGSPGHIVLVVPAPGGTALSAAISQALTGLAEGLAVELRDAQVRVTVVGGPSAAWEPAALADVVAKVATSASVPGVSVRSC